MARLGRSQPIQARVFGPRLIIVAAPAATGRPKVWTGSAWANKPAKVYMGAGPGWVEKPVKTWTGSTWKVAT